MNPNLRILISNDDGIYAEGIEVLYQQLRELYEDIWVVAPDRNQSAASHSLTLDNPLRIQPLNRKNFIAVKGTPTDSVFIAVNQLLDPKPNIVVSGINLGANMGDDVIYSGTVAAATEGRNLGLPAIAVSLCGHEHYWTAAYFALQILMHVAECPIPTNQILNINVPDLPLEEVKGIKVTRLGKRASSEIVVPAKDLRGSPIYWIGPQAPAIDRSEDTDFWAIEHGYVSVTPLQIDLTAYSSMEDVSHWLAKTIE